MAKRANKRNWTPSFVIDYHFVHLSWRSVSEGTLSFDRKSFDRKSIDRKSFDRKSFDRNHLTENHLTESHLTENQMTENHLTEIIWPKSIDRKSFDRNYFIRLRLSFKLEFINKLIIMQLFHEYLQIYRYLYAYL